MLQYFLPPLYSRLFIFKNSKICTATWWSKFLSIYKRRQTSDLWGKLLGGETVGYKFDDMEKNFLTL